MPGVHAADRVHQLLAHSILQQVAGRAGVQCAKDVRIGSMSREHDDACLRQRRPDRHDGLDPAHLWHFEVHEHDIGREGAAPFHGLVPVRRFTHHDQIRLVAQDRRNAFPQQRVIVDGEDPDRRHLQRF